MRDRRTDIIDALRKLLAHQRWHDVEILGLHIARTKWPELQATESRSDGGEDGTSFAASDDGKRRVLACSASATLTKIRTDAKRLQSRGVHPDVLVFFTPQPVVHIMAEEWRQAIKDEFGHELHVIGQAEIVQTLENPAYDWISRTVLELEFSGLPDPARDEAAVRQAAADVLEGFRRFHGYNAAHQVDLTLMRRAPKNASRAPEPLFLDQVIADLINRRPVVLTGLPGAGKTITLLRLAELLLSDRSRPIPLIISIPGWLASGGTLLNFACESLAPSGLPADRLHQMLAQGRIALLLNGWNETPEGGAAQAAALIRDFASRFPGVPLALSTRQTRHPQPIAAELQLEVQPLSPEQKLQIIRSHPLRDPERFLRWLRENRPLSRLTDTPLFLAAAMRLSDRLEEIPTGRNALLSSLVGDLEDSPEHRIALEAGPCQGHHRRFVEDLAAAMMSASGTAFTRTSVLREITRIGRSLEFEGLCPSPPNPVAVLDCLLQHHFLAAAPGPSEVFGFSHQQVQEWFAAQALARRVEALTQTPSDADLTRFHVEILDQPRWHESLCLMIEELAAAGRHNEAAAVIRWALPVDLILAAELAGLTDAATWTSVQEVLSSALRDWYAQDLPSARECAVTAMLATGRADFADILWPLIEDPNEQQAFWPFRTAMRMGTNVLGADLPQRFVRLVSRRQTLVLRELCRYGGPPEAAFARDIAQTTPDPGVKLAALESLIFLGERQAAAEIAAAQREPWSEDIYRRVLAYLPDPEAERFRERARHEFAQAADPGLQRAALGFLGRLNDPNWLDRAKEGIAQVLAASALGALGNSQKPGNADPSPHLLHEYVILIQRGDLPWLQDWAVKNIGRDLLWERPFGDLIPELPEPLQLRLLGLLGPRSDLPGQRQRLAQLASLGAPAVLAEMLRLFLPAKAMGAPGEATADALKHALGDAPVGPLTEAISAVAGGLSEVSPLHSLLDIVGPHAALDFRLRFGTTPKQKRALRTVALRAAAQLTDPSEHRSGRAHLSVLLGSVGDPSDTALIAGWLSDERDLWLGLRQEWAEARSRKPYRPQARRDITSWWSWYVGALVGLQCPEAERVLLGLLDSKLTLADAASALVQWSVLEGSIPSEPGYHPGAWAEIPPQGRLESPTTLPVIQVRAEAIHAAILRARAEPPGDVPVFADLPTAVAALGFLGDPRALPLMVEVTQGADGSGALVRLYYSLTIRGARFSAAAVREAMEAFIAQHERPVYGGGDQWYMVCRALAVLLFSDDPTVGIERIRRLPPERLRGHDAREIFTILGRCASGAAADYLLEVSALGGPPVPTVVLHALAAQPDPRCHNRLAEILAAPPAAGRHQAGHEMEHDALRLAQEGPTFRDALVRGLSSLAPDSLSGLQIGLLVQMGTPESVLTLLTQGGGGHHAIERSLQEAVLEKIPMGTGPTYHLVARPCADLKRRIFELYASGGPGRADAYAALNLFRQFRAVYGLPADEPLHPDISRLSALGRPWPLTFSTAASPSSAAHPGS